MTARLEIRPYRKADLPGLPELIGDWEVARWLSRSPYPYTDDDARDWLRLSRRIRWQRKGLPCAIVRRSDGQLIGGIGINYSDGEIGYWLGRPYWGAGYATEAVGCVCRFALEEKRLRLLWAAAYPENKPSHRVLEKVGFEQDGHRPYRMRDGEADALYFKLTREKWMALND